MQETFTFQKVSTPPVCFSAEGLNGSDKLFLMLSRVAVVNEGKWNKAKRGKRQKKWDIRKEEEWKRMACSLVSVCCPHIPAVLTALFTVWMTCSHSCPFFSHAFLGTLT